MGGFTERARALFGRLLWLDSMEYAARLFANGRAPWMDVPALVAWYRKTQSLLHSDVVGIPVWRVAEAWLEAHPELLAAMSARTRAVYPLRTLLADPQFRAHVVAIASDLRGVGGNALLALVLPSPRRAVAAAYTLAFPGGESLSVGEDEADAAAPYIADFLRDFASVGIDAILLEEDALSAPASAAELAWYQSVFNVVAHYRWDVGLRTPRLGFASEDSPLSFVIAPASVDSILTGLEVPEAFWRGEQAPAERDGGFRFLTVPPLAQPETVLERLASLRGALP